MIKSLKDVIILGNQKILGEGAFSEVIKVRNKLDNKIYALKKIQAKNLNPEDYKNL